MNLRNLLTSLFLVAGSLNAAAVYDLYNDVTPYPGVNPNGPWAFRSGTDVMPYQSSWGAYAPSTAPGSFLPTFTPSCVTGWVCVHSYDNANGGLAGGESNLTWTAPESGIIDISGTIFYAHDPLSRSNDFQITLEGTAIDSGSVGFNHHEDLAHAYTFSYSGLAVTAGDVLKWEFTRSAGQEFGSIDAFNLIVTETAAEAPEPGSVTLLLSGLGFLGGKLWRKRVS